MAITINGSGTITGISAGGYPDGTVTAADLSSSLDLTGKTVTLPSGTGGKILNVVNVNKPDFTSQAYSQDTFYDISGLTLNITPSATNSKILVMYRLGIGMPSGATALIRLLRNGTAIGNGNAEGQRLQALDCTGRSPNIYEPMPISGQYLDSPGLTSLITYKLQWGAPFGSGTFKLNASSDDANNTDRHRQSSTFTLMEVGS